MRVLLIGPLILLLLLGCPSCHEELDDRPADWTGPIAASEASEHDFGTLFAGARAEAQFEILNRGGRDLEILRSHADCGCTKPRFDRLLIPPGEKARMTVELIAPTIHNPMRKRIHVYTNDPYLSPLEFVVSMRGMGEASIHPTELAFDGVVPPEGLHRTIDVELPPGHELVGVAQILEQVHEPNAREIDVRLHPEKKGALDLVILPPAQTLVLRDYLQFKLEARRPDGQVVLLQPQGIQISGEVEAEFRARPGLVDFGWVKSGEEPSARLQILRRGRPLELQGVGSVAGVRVEKLSEAGLLELTWTEPERGPLRGFLEVEGEDGATLRIPVLGWSESR